MYAFIYYLLDDSTFLIDGSVTLYTVSEPLIW